MNEILRRVSEPRLPMPEYKSGIRALSDLGLSELQRLHDRPPQPESHRVLA
ncbi:hypothetical protein JHV666_06070 [Mycobacterium avium subsp. hominissuis]|nr:hypothetical protein O982_17385 [Mycobacterium avium 10-5581]